MLTSHSSGHLPAFSSAKSPSSPLHLISILWKGSLILHQYADPQQISAHQSEHPLLTPAFQVVMTNMHPFFQIC